MPFVIIILQGLLLGVMIQGLDLLLDIMTYFRRESTFPMVRRFGDDKPIEVESTGSGVSFVQREQIADRFRCLVHYMVRQQGVGELTILAHSQGTITAIQQLETIDQWLGKELPKIQLITMGSPYTHIYQHYFPDQFTAPSLKCIEKWINIYTIDDYVGTWIDNSATVGTVPKNIERERVAKAANPDGVSPIGHNGYWTDEVVMQIIADEAPF